MSVVGADPTALGWSRPEGGDRAAGDVGDWYPAHITAGCAQTAQAKDYATLRAAVRLLAAEPGPAAGDRDRHGERAAAGTPCPTPTLSRPDGLIARRPRSVIWASRLQHTAQFRDTTTPNSKAKPGGVRGCEIRMDRPACAVEATKLSEGPRHAGTHAARRPLRRRGCGQVVTYTGCAGFRPATTRDPGCRRRGDGDGARGVGAAASSSPGADGQDVCFAARHPTAYSSLAVRPPNLHHDAAPQTPSTLTPPRFAAGGRVGAGAGAVYRRRSAIRSLCAERRDGPSVRLQGEGANGDVLLRCGLVLWRRRGPGDSRAGTADLPQVQGETGNEGRPARHDTLRGLALDRFRPALSGRSAARLPRRVPHHPTFLDGTGDRRAAAQRLHSPTR